MVELVEELRRRGPDLALDQLQAYALRQVFR